MHVCIYVHTVHSLCVNTCTYDKYVRKYICEYVHPLFKLRTCTTRTMLAEGNGIDSHKWIAGL